jgi:glutamate-1-semialdehyde 2,1-aminomutase
MAAGAATLEVLAGNEGAYARLDELGERLQRGLEGVIAATATEACVSRAGSTLTLFFRPELPTNYDEARDADLERFGRFHRAMLDGGVHLAPAAFEGWFISLAHDEVAIDRTIEAAEAALRESAVG